MLDDDDTYLVVAADKGTATLSRHGEPGRRALRLLARRRVRVRRLERLRPQGARHHRARRVGVAQAPLPRARHRPADRRRSRSSAIGDMSGDVFGNGMLLSDRIRLVAAYDHRHVFLDPDPDPDRGFAERKRLFELAGSSWDDYDRDAISEGGGVWPRAAKSIPLSPQVRAALGVEDEALAPDRRDPRDPPRAGRPALERRHRHRRQGLDRDRRRRPRPRVRRDPRRRVRPALPRRRRGRQPRPHAARADRVRRRRRARQRRLHRQLGRRRLLRPRGQPEDPARTSPCAAASSTPRARDELLRAVTDDVVAHVLYDSFLQAQILAQEVARLGRADVRLRGPDGRARGRGPARPRRRVPAELGGDGRAPARRPRPRAARARRPARLRQARADRRAAALGPPGGAVARARPARRTSRRSSSSASATCSPSTRCAASSSRRSSPTTSSTRSARRSSAALMAERGAEPADVVRAYRVARELVDAVAPLGGDRAPRPGGRPRRAVGADGRASTGSSRRPRAGTCATPSPGSTCATEIADGRRGASAARRDPADARRRGVARGARARSRRRLVEQGVPGEMARAHAYRRALEHAPDIVAIARLSGRSVEEVARAFFRLGQALQLDVARARDRAAAGRPRGCSAGRCRPCATTSSPRADSWPSARCATRRTPRPTRRSTTSCEANSDGVARLAGFTRALAGEGADLAGLTLAVRQLRALVD